MMYNLFSSTFRISLSGASKKKSERPDEPSCLTVLIDHKSGRRFNSVFWFWKDRRICSMVVLLSIKARTVSSGVETFRPGSSAVAAASRFLAQSRSSAFANRIVRPARRGYPNATKQQSTGLRRDHRQDLQRVL